MVFPKSSSGLESLGAVVEGWDAPSEKLRNPPKSYKKQLPYSEELARFGGGDAGVGGEAVEMVEARARGPRWESGFAQLGEALLEAHHAAFVFAKELIFPERGHAIDFEGSAEAQADFVQSEPREPFANGLERGGGDDRGAVRDRVVRKTPGRIAHQDLLLEKHAEPLGRVIVAFGEREGMRGNAAPVAGNRECDVTQIRSESGADQVHGRSALAIDQAPIHRIERPGAVQRQAAGRTQARLSYTDGVK